MRFSEPDFGASVAFPTGVRAGLFCLTTLRWLYQSLVYSWYVLLDPSDGF